MVKSTVCLSGRCNLCKGEKLGTNPEGVVRYPCSCRCHENDDGEEKGLLGYVKNLFHEAAVRLNHN